MNPEDETQDKYSRGYVNVNINFEVTSGDFPDDIGKNIEAFIKEKMNQESFPYGSMSIDQIEVDTSECEYEDWYYEDRINYIEDSRDSQRLGE
mgnify:CR=1 FL=1|tara:strand:- start:4841 stop:5119 length:279 start_codon:yes stop_codon:yes gene_type:complete